MNSVRTTRTARGSGPLTSVSSQLRPYSLYVQVVSGAPTAEVEPNNNGQTPNPVPASGFMSGRYQMVNESGERFEIDVPTFSLDSPDNGRRVLN